MLQTGWAQEKEGAENTKVETTATESTEVQQDSTTVVQRTNIDVQQDSTAVAQETDSEVQEDVAEKVTTSVERTKVDGVVAVVGDYIILESDIDKSYIDLQNQGMPIKDIPRCQLLGKLMEDKLYAHQAVQDSLEVSDKQVTAQTEQQLNYLVSQVGTMENLLAYYKKSDEESFREELFQINKIRSLAENMQSKVVDEIEVTPEEVRQWFNDIPEDERPVFGAELEVAQIVKTPEVPEEEKQKVVNRLKEMKRDIEENGASFATKAILYSKDPGSSTKGGFYHVTKQTGFAKEFMDVAYSLREGEISEPFESNFGWHIIKIDKIKGQELDLRHIILIPDIPEKTLEKTKKELEEVREKIINGEVSFGDAAREYSDEKETKFEGGQLRNPENMDTRFELTNLDPSLYSQVRDLKTDEISRVYKEEDPRQPGRVMYKILRVTNRYDEHKADYVQDYLKIKELALKEKQIKAIREWMEKTIEDTYIMVNSDYRDCDFSNKWVKK
ncbi:peptidylprolyl isomerase [Sinomicrobium sp. FJxs]|uniref:Peptidylprolyl isomerase n=2 Tax=Sinomicrobium weinanense TaxID=2842200 RepID=A0A926Q4R5_9FLAO|nr:peptidylprolyl isomerase [Sinomicrobium weinanense]MBU3123403.1 peptidylprolyl isomerase [Sinomicrobium weinanense]